MYIYLIKFERTTNKMHIFIVLLRIYVRSQKDIKNNMTIKPYTYMFQIKKTTNIIHKEKNLCRS